MFCLKTEFQKVTFLSFFFKLIFILNMIKLASKQNVLMNFKKIQQFSFE